MQEVTGSSPVFSTKIDQFPRASRRLSGRSPVRARYSPPKSLPFNFYIYIIYSAYLNRYYIGCCENIDKRLQQHNTSRNISTKAGLPWILKHSEIFFTRTDALKREKEIKSKKSRKYIEWLIRS